MLKLYTEKKYFERRPPICVQITELSSLLPIAAEDIELNHISSTHTMFESVGKCLQSDDTSLNKGETGFDLRSKDVVSVDNYLQRFSFFELASIKWINIRVLQSKN